jgi:hypothetical protein
MYYDEDDTHTLLSPDTFVSFLASLVHEKRLLPNLRVLELHPGQLEAKARADEAAPAAICDQIARTISSRTEFAHDNEPISRLIQFNCVFYLSTKAQWLAVMNLNLHNYLMAKEELLPEAFRDVEQEGRGTLGSD